MFFLTVEMKNYNAIIDGRKLFDEVVKYGVRTWHDYATGSILDYTYFKEFCKIIATLQVRGADLKVK